MDRFELNRRQALMVGGMGALSLGMPGMVMGSDEQDASGNANGLASIILLYAFAVGAESVLKLKDDNQIGCGIKIKACVRRCQAAPTP